MKTKILKTALITLLTFNLTNCGGGSGKSNSNNTNEHGIKNNPPVAKDLKISTDEDKKQT